MTSADPEDEPVGRCYTKARRAPTVIGVVPGGAGRALRIPFGPYTLTQLGALVATVLGLLATRPVWGGHGWADVILLIVLPIALAFGLRHLQIDGRNPAAAMFSVAVMLSSPRRGRLHGAPYRAPGPRRLTSLVTLTPPPVPAAAAAARISTSGRPAPASPRQSARAAPPPGPRIASGAQALLNRRTTTTTSREH